jgi:hypothetical protein
MEDIKIVILKLGNGLYYLPNIVRVIKSRRMRVGGALSTYGGRERCVQGFGGET